MINPWNIIEVVQLSDPSAPSDWAAASAGSSLEQAVCLCVFSISAGKLYHEHSPSSLYSCTSCASCTLALPVQSWHKNDQTCLLYMANQEEIEKCFHYVIEWYIYIIWYLITVPSIGVSKCFQLVYLWLGVAVHIHASDNCSTVAFPLANASAAHTSVWKWAVSNSIIPFWMTNWKSHCLTLIVKFRIRKVRSSR